MAPGAVVSGNAAAFAADLVPVLADLRISGATSLMSIAAALNRPGALTRHSEQWQVSNVSNLRARLI